MWLGDMTIAVDWDINNQTKQNIVNNIHKQKREQTAIVVNSRKRIKKIFVNIFASS